MDEKELLNKIQIEVKGIVEKGSEGFVSKAELDARVESINTKISSLSEGAIHEMAESLSKMASQYGEILDASKEAQLAVKALENRSVGQGERKTLAQKIEDGFMEYKDKLLTEKNDDNGRRLSMKDYFAKHGNQHSPTITVKSAVEMLQSNIVGANVGTMLLAQTVGVVQIPLSIYPNIFGYMPTAGLTKPTMSYTVYYEFESGTATKPEGTASAKSSLKIKTVEIKSFAIATHVVLSEETMDDLPSVIDELQRVLPVDIKEKIETAVLGATGDDSSAIAGILTSTKHTDFVASNYTDTVKGANIIDVISKMKLQAEAAKYKPNMVILNPATIDNIASTKDLMENSVKDNRVLFGTFGTPTYINGLVVVASENVIADQAIVLDINKTKLGIRKDMTIEIGRNGTDLVEGQYTAVATMRVAFGVAVAAAVIYCDGIVAATAVIEAGA